MVSLREMARADVERVPPEWLRLLLAATFFQVCPQHPDANRATRTSGCNSFCTDCADRPLCHACIPGEHAGHKLIQVRKSSGHNRVQVRKSSGHNVVKMKDDVEGTQPYLFNNENVLFLTARPQTGKGKAGEHRCNDCVRALLHEAYRFCSLGCKLECMEGDFFSVSFAVQPESENEALSEDETQDDASSRPTKRLRNTEAGAARGSRAEEDGARTSAPAAAAVASRINLASRDDPSSSKSQ